MQWQIVQRHEFAENGEGSFQANNPLSSVQDVTGCKKMPTPASHHAILVFIIPVLTAFIQVKFQTGDHLTDINIMLPETIQSILYTLYVQLSNSANIQKDSSKHHANGLRYTSCPTMPCSEDESTFASNFHRCNLI
ncbi:Uncharacterized protein TCM_025139 [Theobroma cacao]|uniref:Uncharacterized protein n=1 Tax=Theobroma cacao TaxID=3641 RepID=A0A061EYM6_THECC|nr:Uncharacterized protein TCM_025139 [Theobroma cacao]